MTRNEFHKLFKSISPIVLPVIHVLETGRTIKNISKIIRSGASGCFLINHDFGVEEFVPIIMQVRAKFPALWLGVNFLATTGDRAFPILEKLSSKNCYIDAYWADDACIDENGENIKAKSISEIRKKCNWEGLYFGGTAFKKQRSIPVNRYKESAAYATQFMDVVTTSGPATGKEVDLEKIRLFRSGVKNKPLAIASGVSIENVVKYADVDCFLIATGINKTNNFYDIDQEKLDKLMKITRNLGVRNLP